MRLADALIVTDSRLVIRVENMVTTSSLEASEVDLNGAMSNYLRLALLVLLLHFSLTDYVDPINVYVENCHTCTGMCVKQAVRAEQHDQCYLRPHTRNIGSLRMRFAARIQQLWPN